MAQLQRLTIAAEQLSGQNPGQISGQLIQLTEAQQHYLHRVLRLKCGDRFIAMTKLAKPQWWLAELQADLAVARMLEAIPVKTELSTAITLIMALPKSGMDDVVRQATEMGVHKIVPILSQRSLLNPSAQKLERWQRIAQEAAEQSERQVAPDILAPLAWPTALQTWHGLEYSPAGHSSAGQGSAGHSSAGHSSAGQDQFDPAGPSPCYLCEARGEHPHLLKLLQSPESALVPQTISIAIGPEGGWTEAEIAQAIAVGYQPVSLGRRVLRAVTAPLVALALLAAVIEESDRGECL